MVMAPPSRPIQPGERAPNFDLPAADRDGRVALADYTGRRPLLVTLLSGIYCPFCRRHIAQLSRTAEKLRGVGVAVAGVVATAPERARLYFRFRPSGVPLGADPDLVTHRAYGVPNLLVTAEVETAVEAAAQRVARDLGLVVDPGAAYAALGAVDGFQPVESDAHDMQRHQAQFYGQFLIDRAGIVRWAYIEGDRRGFEEMETLPDDAELTAAARAL
jgi:peroxiredoxin